MQEGVEIEVFSKNKRVKRKKLKQKEMVLGLPFIEKKASIVPITGRIFHNVIVILKTELTKVELNDGQLSVHGCMVR